MKRHAAWLRHVGMPSPMTVYSLRRSAPAREPKSRMLARHRQLPSSRPPRLSIYSRSLASCSASMDCCGVAGQRQQQSNMKGGVEGCPAAARKEAGGGAAGSEAPAGRSSLAARQQQADDEPQRLLPAAMGLASAAPSLGGGAAHHRRHPALLPLPAGLRRLGALGARNRAGAGPAGWRRERGGRRPQGSAARPRRHAGAAERAAAPRYVLHSRCSLRRGWAAGLGRQPGCDGGGRPRRRRRSSPVAAARGAGRAPIDEASAWGAYAAAKRLSESPQPTTGHLAACVKNRASRQSQAAHDDCTILREAQGAAGLFLPACCRPCQRLHRRGMRPTRARLLIPTAPCYCDWHAPQFGHPGAPVRAAACHRPHRRRLPLSGPSASLPQGWKFTTS